MVTILHTGNTKSRTFGWVQNPSNFRSLCDVVAVFDQNSQKHRELIEKTLPELVGLENGRDDLVAALNARPLKISYLHLVGTGKTQRATAPCNAIIQAAVHGQGHKAYTDNWTADGFIRWAHCLGFIMYNYTDDTFSITESGLELSAAHETGEALNGEETRVLTEAMLSYPPAVRVLSLLAEENAHLTKFEIGRQLGFTGEGGFTSMPQSVFVRSLSKAADSNERKKMRANWEGSSDKYARMIASWLEKLGLIDKVAKEITVVFGAQRYTESVGQSYVITAQGLTMLHRARGASRHNRISKTVCCEMLATKGVARDYLRLRRGLTIKALCEHSGAMSADAVVAYLASQDIIASRDVVDDDVQGLISIGLEIDVREQGYIWRDTINDFIIPVRSGAAQSEQEEIKDELRGSIRHISHDYLSLIDLAYDGSQSRLFEMKTLQLLIEECGFAGTHLGGSRRPDGAVYTDKLADNYGVIIDTKAYSGGYSLPISHADEMQRYVQENQRRDETENPNKWWEVFAEGILRYSFMFVAAEFTGRYQDKVDRICRITSTKGAAIEVYDLLLIAESVKDSTYGLAEIENVLFQ